MHPSGLIDSQFLLPLPLQFQLLRPTNINFPPSYGNLADILIEEKQLDCSKDWLRGVFRSAWERM
jgi:hypothetical protein